MSNVITTMENKLNRLHPKDLKSAQGAKGQTINFQDKVLPKALYVGVKTGTIKLGDETSKLQDIPVAFTVEETPAGIIKLLDFLNAIPSEDITRVIMDNTTDFKIRSFGEFLNDIVTQASKLKDLK